MSKWWSVASAAVLVGLAGCSATGTAGTERTPEIQVENPWVRTTEGSKDATMTGAFMTLTNPGTTDVDLKGVDYAGTQMVELHDMVKGPDGKMVMQQIPTITVKAGEHKHLKPFSLHIMFMKLNQPLKVGDEVKMKLHFSNGTTKEVTAPVKVFTEETEHYHPSMTPAPTPSK